MQILGLIPGRGGSKSIHRKNVTPLAGKPLIAYTCTVARASRWITRVLLSTDDEEIAAIGRKLGADVPFMRPPELALDDTPMFDVVRHALGWLKHNEGYQPHLVVLLQPTSPLRRERHIDEAIELLLETKADSVVSVVEVPHQYNPVSLLRIEGGQLAPYLPGEGFRILRRQEKPKVYARNGPAVLVTRCEVIERSGTLYGHRIVPYIMGWPESLDIDSELDILLAESLMQERGKDR